MLTLRASAVPLSAIFLVVLGGCASQSRKDAALITAAHRGSVQEIRQALANGANVNGTGEHAGTALFEAAGQGRLDAAQVLLDRGAHVNQAMDTGDTPLHIAAFYGQTEMVRLLLARGADPSRRDKRGHTPLDKVTAARRLPSQRDKANFIETQRLLQDAGKPR